MCALSGDDLEYITEPIRDRYAPYNTRLWSLLLNDDDDDDNATDRQTDLLVLTRYGFPIQRLVWFLFTKFVSCSFLVVVGHFFFSIPFSKQEWPNLFFFSGLTCEYLSHLSTANDVSRVIVTLSCNARGTPHRQRLRQISMRNDDYNIAPVPIRVNLFVWIIYIKTHASNPAANYVTCKTDSEILNCNLISFFLRRSRILDEVLRRSRSAKKHSIYQHESSSIPGMCSSQ